MSPRQRIKRANRYLDQGSPCDFDENAKNALKTLKPKDTQSVFIIADIQLNNLHNAQVAEIMFGKVIDDIAENVKPNREIIGATEHMIDRIEDYQDREMIDDIPLQHAFESIIEAKTKLAEKENTGTVEEKIEKKKTWTSDRQNVHDSRINDELVRQVRKAKTENALDVENKHDFADFQRWVAEKRLGNTEHRVVERIMENNPVPGLDGLGERDLVEILWKRAHDGRNKTRVKDLEDAILDSINDCVENNNVVCLTGRTTKMWQALAVLDADDGMGVMKSKQMLRNEFYDRCSKATAKVLDNIEPEMKEKYDKGEDAEEVSNMIKEEMDKVAAEMESKFEPTKLQQYLEECKSVI
jgi:hypothetical protein